MSIALEEAMDLLQQEKRLSAADSYSLCSLAVGFEVSSIALTALPRPETQRPP